MTSMPNLAASSLDLVLLKLRNLTPARKVDTSTRGEITPQRASRMVLAMPTIVRHGGVPVPASRPLSTLISSLGRGDRRALRQIPPARENHGEACRYRRPPTDRLLLPAMSSMREKSLQITAERKKCTVMVLSTKFKRTNITKDLAQLPKIYFSTS